MQHVTRQNDLPWNMRDHNTIAFDEDLVGDVSMRPNDILLASYGRHTKIPGERGGKQPARTGCCRIDDSWREASV